MISVITPSYGQLDWLRLCAASVADQEGIDVEHIVQDGGTDGISEAQIQPARGAECQLRLYVEQDKGMYDAINRGLRRSEGEICAYLNCDEQYLPGALAQVTAAFGRSPKTDVLFAGSLVVDGRGTLPLQPPGAQATIARPEGRPDVQSHVVDLFPPSVVSRKQPLL